VKTVLFVAAGRHQRRAIERARELGLRVVAHDTRGARETNDPVASVSLHALLDVSDIVVLHVPLTPQTYHFVDAELIASMKPGAFLVNVSRGPVVDTAALIEALDRGRLSGAGIDVVEGEPNPPIELVGRADVIATPHVAFSSDAALIELRTRAADEVVRVLGGAEPRFACNAPSSHAR